MRSWTTKLLILILFALAALSAFNYFKRPFAPNLSNQEFDQSKTELSPTLSPPVKKNLSNKGKIAQLLAVPFDLNEFAADSSSSARMLRFIKDYQPGFVLYFDEANASMQQHLQVLADQNDLLYAGLLPFADPLELAHDIKGHMVRPRNVHIANKICFTIAGGETTYNLGQYLISADWLAFADLDLARQTLAAQVEFYQTLAKRPLSFVLEEAGDLPAAIVAENKKMLQSLGYNFA